MKVVPLDGWILVGREEDPETGVMRKTGPFHVAWFDLFTYKHEALRFLKENKWDRGYRAVRGRITALSSGERSDG